MTIGCDTLIGHVTLLFFAADYAKSLSAFYPVRKDDQVCEYLIMLASWCEFINSREFGKPTNPPNMVSMHTIFGGNDMAWEKTHKIIVGDQSSSLIRRAKL